LKGKVIASVKNFSEVSKVLRVVDGVEFRIDLFRKLPEPKSVKIEKISIVTIRKPEDGGKFIGREEERVNLLENYSKFCDYVDLEHYLADEVFEKMSCKVIESYHNFNETPDYDFLKGIVENRRGDVVKIATFGRSKKDVEKIVKLLCDYENVVAFLMGEEFSFTRIFSLFLGSPFIYCGVGEGVAPGQYDVFKAVKILKELGYR